MRKKSKAVHPIIEVYKHEPFAGQAFPVVNVNRAGALVVSAAINPDEDGQLISRSFGGRPDIEIKAILTDAAVGHELMRPRHAAFHDGLDRAWRKSICGPNSVPCGGRLRCAPAQSSHGRRG